MGKELAKIIIFAALSILNSFKIRKSTSYMLKYWSQSTSFAHDCFESMAVVILIQSQ